MLTTVESWFKWKRRCLSLIQNGLNSMRASIQRITTIIPTFLTREIDLLIKILKILYRLNDSTWSYCCYNEMWIFVPKPSCKSPCVWSTSNNPGLICDAIQIMIFYMLNKVSNISQGLLWVQEFHIFQAKRIFSKRKRSSIKSML